MKKLITVRQLVLILLVSLLALKVLYLPSLLSKQIGRDAYLFVLLFLLLDFLVLLMLLFMFNKHPELSFYDLIKNIFGTAIAKVIMFVFFVFFFIKCWGVFQSNFNYLNENLYTNLNWLTFSVPILVAVLYMSKFGVNAAARLAELVVPIVIFGFLLSLTVGLIRADFSYLLPLMENGFSKLPDMFQFSFWFGDYVIFIVFFGNIKEEKNQNKKILFSMLIAIVFVAFFIAVVFAAFNYNAVCHSNAISDMLQVTPSTSDIGSFDWVLILIWDVALFLYFTFNSLGAFYCFRQTFFKKWQLLSISLILIAILGLNMFTNFDINTSVTIIKSYLWYFCFFAQYILPFIIFLFSFKLKRRKVFNAKVCMEK